MVSPTTLQEVAGLYQLAMVTHRLNKNFLLAIGASKQIVQTYPEYNRSVYGKVSFHF